MLYKFSGPYVSALSHVPRTFALEASKHFYCKSLVNLKEKDKSREVSRVESKRSFADQDASKQNEPIQITEPMSKSTTAMQSVPLNGKGDFENEESQREALRKVYSEIENKILKKQNVIHKDNFFAKDYFNENPDGKPTDTKNSGTAGVEENQKNDSHKILEATTPDIDPEEDFFNDYADGKKNDPRVKYKQTLKDEYSPYVQRLLLNEREKPDAIGTKTRNMSLYDKTEKALSTGINPTFDGLPKKNIRAINKTNEALSRGISSTFEDLPNIISQTLPTGINTAFDDQPKKVISPFTETEKTPSRGINTAINDLPMNIIPSYSKTNEALSTEIYAAFDDQPKTIVPPYNKTDEALSTEINKDDLPKNIIPPLNKTNEALSTGINAAFDDQPKTIIPPYNRTQKGPTIDVNRTFNDLAKLCRDSSVNITKKLTGPLFNNNGAKEINKNASQLIHNHSKTTKYDPTETISTFSELAKRFLKAANRNSLKKAEPVINNIKHAFKNQTTQSNAFINRKISNYINPPILDRVKSRIPKSKTKIFLNDIEINKQFDEVAQRGLKSPINEIDEILLKAMEKPRNERNTSTIKKDDP